MKKFAIMGVGGYIAPRHLKAIKDTGNDLVAAFDPSDSVGILDQHFNDVEFFCNFEQFYNYISSNPVDFISICSPNHLHKAHIAFALKCGADVICEKPLVLTAADLDDLAQLERETKKKVYTVLQLREHSSIISIKEKLESKSNPEKLEIDLCYLTSRGPWFHRSWKGNTQLSGGLATNIGVHFFDMITWLVGKINSIELHYKDDHLVAGYMQFQKANVRWLLSVDRKYLPTSATQNGMTTFRSITIDGNEIEFSKGFTDLHTIVYQQIFKGNGYGIEDARQSIEIVEQIRNSEGIGITSNSHPLLEKYELL